jgi:hypothetical protein
MLGHNNCYRGAMSKPGLFAIFALCLLSACVSGQKKAARPQAEVPGDVVEVHLMTSPIGLNLDNTPGPDGFEAKIFFNDGRNPKPVPVRKGALEILMFDGTLRAGGEGVQPLKTWRFSMEELAALEFKSKIGTGYNFTLAWGENKPTRQNISVAARYIPSAGEPIFSAPSTVTVGVK